MKTVRKLSCLLMIFVLSITLSSGVFASEANELTGPSDVFISVCDKFFSSDGDYRAVDLNGNDVTMSFYSSYINAYNGGRYDVIWNAVKDGLAYITWENDDTSSGARLSMNGSASDSFYVLGSATTLSKTFEMIYTVSGTYTYHDSTSQISDYSNAVLNIDYFSAGALFGYSLYNVSTSAKVATNKKSITFSASFCLTLSCDSYNITGLTWWEEDFGPYSGSVTGYT